jgi:hypothetical protein
MHTRSKFIIGIALAFFLLVNTSDLWTDDLGFYAMIFSIILFLTFIGLTIILVIQLFYAIKEQFKIKDRNLTISVLVSVLILTVFMPFGIVNFKKFESKDILVAQREGVANCSITLKLKENSKFTFSNICFGTSMTKGEFTIGGDTIYFHSTRLGRNIESFYEFGIQENENRIMLFSNKQDTVGLQLRIIGSKLTYKTYDD